MTAIAALLASFDDAWGHAWESVASVLGDLEDREAFWQSPAYADVPPEDGWPPPGSVAWHVAHLAHCKRYYTRILLREGHPGRPKDKAWTPLATVAELTEALQSAHAAQRAALAALGDADLCETAGNGTSFREFVSITTRHDTWHAGQIAVARRLFRGRSEPAATDRV